MAINFETLDYLKDGNEKQVRALQVLTSHSVFGNLQGFDPLLIGTIPLNIDIEKSDLDIICCWKSKNLFIETLIENFAHHRAFLLTEKKIANHETIIAMFQIDEFEIEIFGQNRPTKQQDGYRHLIIEHKILSSNDETFRQKIIYLKKQGLTTEQAFAKQLDLTGDAYQELLKFGEQHLNT
jgi:Domain of unknown function (DUF4269)